MIMKMCTYNYKNTRKKYHIIRIEKLQWTHPKANCLLIYNNIQTGFIPYLPSILKYTENN